MAILYENCTTGGANVANPTNFNHEVITANPNRYLKVTITTRSDLVFGRNVVGGVTYGGDIMALLAGPIAQGNADSWYYYLVNPQTGINQVSIAFAAQFAGCNCAADAASYIGVDVVTPHGVHQTATGVGANLQINLASEDGELCVDGYGEIGVGGATPDAGQTRRCELVIGAGGARAYVSASEEPGAVLVNMLWTGINAQPKTLIGVPLKPHVGLFTRAFEYEFDIWDPLQRIIGRDGHEVQPNEVRADKWGKLLGFRSPSSKVFASLAESPDAFYIAGVTSDGESVRITPDEKLFADMILKRLAR